MSDVPTPESKKRGFIVWHPVGGASLASTPEEALIAAGASIPVSDEEWHRYRLRELGETAIAYEFSVLQITSELAANLKISPDEALREAIEFAEAGQRSIGHLDDGPKKTAVLDELSDMRARWGAARIALRSRESNPGTSEYGFIKQIPQLCQDVERQFGKLSDAPPQLPDRAELSWALGFSAAVRLVRMRMGYEFEGARHFRAPFASATDDQVRSRWRQAGGDFIGPNALIGVMAQASLLPFLRELGAAAAAPSTAPSVEEVERAIRKGAAAAHGAFVGGPDETAYDLDLVLQRFDEIVARLRRPADALSATSHDEIPAPEDTSKALRFLANLYEHHREFPDPNHEQIVLALREGAASIDRLCAGVPQPAAAAQPTEAPLPNEQLAMNLLPALDAAGWNLHGNLVAAVLDALDEYRRVERLTPVREDGVSSPAIAVNSGPTEISRDDYEP
jgi:hypothetical protein